MALCVFDWTFLCDCLCLSGFLIMVHDRDVPFDPKQAIYVSAGTQNFVRIAKTTRVDESKTSNCHRAEFAAL